MGKVVKLGKCVLNQLSVYNVQQLLYCPGTLNPLFESDRYLRQKVGDINNNKGYYE